MESIQPVLSAVQDLAESVDDQGRLEERVLDQEVSLAALGGLPGSFAAKAEPVEPLSTPAVEVALARSAQLAAARARLSAAQAEVRVNEDHFLDQLKIEVGARKTLVLDDESLLSSSQKALPPAEREAAVQSVRGQVTEPAALARVRFEFLDKSRSGRISAGERSARGCGYVAGPAGFPLPTGDRRPSAGPRPGVPLGRRPFPGRRPAPVRPGPATASAHPRHAGHAGQTLG